MFKKHRKEHGAPSDICIHPHDLDTMVKVYFKKMMKMQLTHLKSEAKMSIISIGY